ncbi:Heat shock 70 kDa protein 12A [Boothiomyces macroporosus]|uniref:Heat shock 70 kDa protein 12A n=1 Tax=Boothiomyces macroporosus TaxID=261099 RepID=A0AAD5Y2H7_9FUNG|nr:Heat shock 70 kDa protein 12A [Boothiomyces macroporosus]
MPRISLQFYTRELKVIDGNEGVWEPLKYGTSAKINYFRLQGNPDYFYVERFKLLLDPTNTQAVPLPPGVTLAKVMCDFLAYMKSTAEDIIKHHQGHNNDPVQWVVTVPAIWSPTAKAKTRQACFDCGMIDSLESSKLLLCYEPQAASIFIQKNSPFMAPNDVVVTLDIGGGTTDITSHEAGSVHIDKAFLDFVQRLVGPECYQTVLAKNSQIALKLISSFEPQKRLLTKDDFDNDYCFASIDIPSEIYSEMSLMQKSLIKQREYQHGCDDKIELTAEEMASFFDPVIDTVIYELEQYFEKLIFKGKRPTKLLIVGGLAGCPYLAERVRDTFGQKYKIGITIPPDPGSAILKGAADFGFNPGKVSRRIWSHSYYLLYSKAYDPQTETPPPNRKIYKQPPNYYYEDYFEITTAGEEMPLNHKVPVPVLSPSDSSKTVRFQLLRQVSTDMMMKVALSCVLKVPPAYIRPGHNNTFRVEIIFHPTEVILQVYHVDSKSYLSGDSVIWEDEKL